MTIELLSYALFHEYGHTSHFYVLFLLNIREEIYDEGYGLYLITTFALFFNYFLCI